MPRVVHFEIYADEPDRALSFYTSVFGWQTQKWEGPQDYWLFSTGDPAQPGINGGLIQRRYPEPGSNGPDSNHRQLHRSFFRRRIRSQSLC